MDGYFRNDGSRDQYAKKLEAYEKAKAEWDAKHPKAEGMFDVLNAKELMEKPFPPSRVSYDDEGVNLHVYGRYNTYDISWDSIVDAADVLGWIKNFCGKTWCDAELIDDFIDCCRNYRKYIKVSDYYD